MSDKHTHIITLCEQLSSEGKTPSVALIRARSALPLPIPEVIKILQKWKQDPDALSQAKRPDSDTVKSAQTLTLEQRVAQLEAEVAQLKAVLKDRDD